MLPFRLRFQTSIRRKLVLRRVRARQCRPLGMIVHSFPLLFAIRTPKPNPQTPKQMPSNTNSTPSTFTTPLPTSQSPFFSSILQVLPRLFSLVREFPDLQHIRVRSPSPPHPFHSPFFFFFFFLSPRSLRQRRVLSRSALRRIHAPIPQSPPAALLLPRRALLHVPRGRSALPVPRNRSRPRVHVRIFPFFLIHQIQLRHAPRRPGTPQSLQKTLLRRLLRLRQQRYPPRSRAFPRPRLRSRPIQAGTANRRRFARSSP